MTKTGQYMTKEICTLLRRKGVGGGDCSMLFVRRALFVKQKINNFLKPDLEISCSTQWFILYLILDESERRIITGHNKKREWLFLR